jgi:hypothetical protein
MSLRTELPRLPRPCLDLCLDLENAGFACETTTSGVCLDCLDLAPTLYVRVQARPPARAPHARNRSRQSRQSRQKLICKGFFLPRPCLDLDQGLGSRLEALA